jgi:tyrosyl-tRNA synthetase
MLKGHPTIDTSPDKINDILNRGVEDIFIKDHLLAQLKSGKQLRVKLGFDPTGPTIHIGRAIVLRKLKAFQDLGHHIVLIVGDFTATIGDPSDKLEKRPMLTSEKIAENLKNYKAIIGKIIDVKKAEFVFNKKWLSKLTFTEVSELAESFSIQQMLARRNFSDRLERGQEISVRELLYPLMQGYDSVMVKADVELGGFDQLFNLKAGRIIQKHFGQPEQDILTTAMLEGTDGRKMSTSWGNVIAITDEPNDMYGKIMSIRDDLITKYFLLCTDVSEEEIEKIGQEMNEGSNPKEFKMRLAREIVTLYHGPIAAEKAELNFVTTFSEGGIPEDVETIEAEKGKLIVDLLVARQIIASKSEWRRLIEGKGVHNAETDETITDQFIPTTSDIILKIGKRRFVKIVAK